MGPRESSDLAGRVREVRLDRFGFGEEGVPTLAAALGLPHRTWTNYESGVAIPALVILRLIALTGVSPLWLLQGGCGKYGHLPGETPGRGRDAR